MPRKNIGDGETNSTATRPVSRSSRSRTTRATARVGAQSVATDPAPRCSDEQIRERAYYIYLERGCSAGDPDEDWRRAERELNGGT